MGNHPREVAERMSSTEDGFVALTAQQSLEHLRAYDLGHVAFQIDRQVELLPVNYACDGQVVVFRTAQGTRLQRAPHFPVTFEADSWDRETGTGWSVVLKGTAREITRCTDLFSKGLRRLNVVPAAPGKRERWIAIFPSEITGRTFKTAGSRS